MKLGKLELVNFRCHESLKLEFRAGLNAIVGANESGKSSILEAIGFALYGSRAIRGSVKSLKRRGATEEMFVSLEWEADGKRYGVSRDEKHAVASCDAGVVAEGKKECDEYLAELIGMDWPEFAASVLCQQHDLKRMVSMTPAERSAFVRRVMGVDAVDAAIKRMRASVREVAAGLPLLRDADEWRGKVEFHEKELAERKRDLAEQRLDMANAEAAMPAADPSALQRETELAVAVGRLEAELAKVRGDIEENRADAPDPPAEPGEARMLRDQIEQIRDRHNARTGAIIAARAKYEDAKRNAEAAECNACGRAFDEESARSARARLSVAASALASREDVPVESIQAQAERLLALQRFETRTARLPALRDKEEELEAALSHARKALAKIGRRADAAREAERMTAVINGMRAQIEGSVARAELTESMLSEARDHLQAVLDNNEVHMTLASKIADYERSIAVADDFRTALLGRIRPELEELASGLMSVLTDGRHEAVELDEDFTPVVYENGEVSQVVSGGTMDCLGLAMRLALGQMIAQASDAPLECLILDEPFGSLDGVRRQNVLNLLDRIKDVYPQVVLVSHVAETKDMADHVLNL